MEAVVVKRCVCVWKYWSVYVKLCIEKDLILHHDNAPAHKVLSVKQFLAQKSKTKM
jgi:hypothetical protein